MKLFNLFALQFGVNHKELRYNLIKISELSQSRNMSKQANNQKENKAHS